MITFNIWGNCMSRDIFNPLQEENRYKVLQYVGVGSSHPISAFADKYERNITPQDIKDYNISNFEKRCLCLDFNKTALDYLIERKSDYILIDMLSCRHNLYKKNENIIVESWSFQLNKEQAIKDFNLDSYEKISSNEIDIKIWEKHIDKFCSFISKYYTPNQIILLDCYGATEYIDEKSSNIITFNSERCERIKKYNDLSKKLVSMFLGKIPDCHVIGFCNNVVADTSHHLGLNPLHYEQSYYEYAACALKTICMGYTDLEEQNILNFLKNIYSEKFTLKYEKLKLNRKLFWSNNALNFTQKLCKDIFDTEVFQKWITIQKNNNSKISVLASANVAGKIFIQALKKYDIKPVFVSSDPDFNKLSKEDFEICSKSDIVVCANVHISEAPKREGVCSVLISDLLKEQCLSETPKDTSTAVINISENIECKPTINDNISETWENTSKK